MLSLTHYTNNFFRDGAECTRNYDSLEIAFENFTEKEMTAIAALFKKLPSRKAIVRINNVQRPVLEKFLKFISNVKQLSWSTKNSLHDNNLLFDTILRKFKRLECLSLGGFVCPEAKNFFANRNNINSTIRKIEIQSLAGFNWSQLISACTNVEEVSVGGFEYVRVDPFEEICNSLNTRSHKVTKLKVRDKSSLRIAIRIPSLQYLTVSSINVRHRNPFDFDTTSGFNFVTHNNHVKKLFVESGDFRVTQLVDIIKHSEIENIEICVQREMFQPSLVALAFCERPALKSFTVHVKLNTLRKITYSNADLDKIKAINEQLVPMIQ